MAQEPVRIRQKSSLRGEESEANRLLNRRATFWRQLKALLRKNLLVAFREKIYNGFCFLLPILLGVTMLYREQASELVASNCTFEMDAPVALPSSGWFRVLQTTYCSYILPCSLSRDCSEEFYITDQELSVNFIIDELYRIMRDETLIRAWMKVIDKFIVIIERNNDFTYNGKYEEFQLKALWGSHRLQLNVEDASVISSLSVKKEFLIKAVKTFIQEAKRNSSLLEDDVFPSYISANFAYLLCDGGLFDTYLVPPDGIGDEEKSRLNGIICSLSNFTLNRDDLSTLAPQINEALNAVTGLNTSIMENLQWVIAWTDLAEAAYHYHLFGHVVDAWQILRQNVPKPAKLATLLCGTSSRLSEIAEKHSWQNLSSKWWTLHEHLLGKDIVLTPLSPVTKKIGDKMTETLSSISVLRKFAVDLFAALLFGGVSFGGDVHWIPIKLLGRAAVITAENFQLLRNRSDAAILDSLFGNTDLDPSFEPVIISFLQDAVAAIIEVRQLQVKYMTKAAVKGLTYGNVLAVISFTGVDSNSTTLLNATKYIIHMQQTKLSVQSEVDMMQAFIQDMVNSAILAVRTGSETNVALYAQKFPRKCGNQTIVNAMMHTHTAVSLHTIIIWVLCLCAVAVNVVIERKMMLKEYCKSAGLSTVTYLVSWQLHAFILMHLPTTLYTVIIAKGAVISYTSPYAVSLFVAINSFAVAAQALAFANCFESPRMAGLTVPIFYLLLRLLGGFISASFFEHHVMIQALLSMVPEFAITIVINGLVRNEERKSPFSFMALFDPLYDYGSFSYSLLILMMFLGAMIHLLLAWYLLEIRSTSYNDVKPWYFPLQRSYWRPTYTFEFLENAGGDYLKQEILHLPVGLSVEHVSMCYGVGKKAKMALKDVTAEFYAGEVTALIGANDSGKTTLLSIMCGLFPPTKGDVVLLGESISSNLKHVYSLLGYCPKDNVLLNKLTVAEHLYFFGSLKGIPFPELRRDVNEVLKIAQLHEVKQLLVENLSDIVKRKLAIGIALLGNTKVIVIDEPTHGVDRALRHAIWSMIFTIKKKRTVIFSTQYLDEAEILGDRIAIMSNGELKCSGSSGFLMANNKGGCFLTFVKKPRRMSLPEIPCIKKLISYLQSYVPDVEIVQNSHKEIEFKLPITDAVTLLNLVSEIDKSLEMFGCTSYGFSEGGLEDVYRNETMPTGSAEKYVSFSSTAGVIEEHPPEEGDLQSYSLSSSNDEILRKSSSMNISIRKMTLTEEHELNALLRAHLGKSSGRRARWIFQVTWMFQRRLIHYFRNWKAPFCSVSLSGAVN
ncbi:ABC transporter, ATP-binding protein [Trichuris suis]|nr:ABC transporter, ATP-binding protein [Trichuris suis]